MSGRGRTWKSDWSDWKDSNHGSDDSARWWAEKRWGQKKTQKSWKWEEDSGEEAAKDGWGDDDWKQKGEDDWNQQHWKAHDNRSAVSSWKNWDQSWEANEKGDDNNSKSTVSTSHRGSFFRLGGLLSTGGRFSSSGGVEGEGDWEETEEDISRKWNADEEDATEEAPQEKPRLPTTPKAPLPPTPPPAAPIGASLKPKPKVPPKMRPTSPKHPPKAKAAKGGETPGAAPALKPRPKARPVVQSAKAPATHTWEETSLTSTSEDDWADGKTRPGGKGWTPTSGQTPPKPKPMPKPPKEPPPKHLLTEPPKAKEDLTLTADVEDFLKSLDVNEEASRALREAPKEVQRMMLQEVQDIPAGRSASAAVKFRVQRFTRIFKQSEAKAAAKGSTTFSVPPKKPPEPPGPPPGHTAKPVPPRVPGPPPGPPPKGPGASPPPPPPDGEDSGEEWPKKGGPPAKPKPPPPPAPPPAAPPAAPPPPVAAPPPPKQQPNAAAANTAAPAANTPAAKTGQPAVPAEQWQQQQQQIWQQQQQQWQQWQVPVATFQPVMGQLNMMAMTMQNLAKMAMAPMAGTTEAAPASNSKSGGAEQAIKVYAEEEAKKFVALHCLSKETEQELLTLSPEDMLNITQSSKNKVDAETPQSKRNADGMEDLVVMSRIRRLKGKESTEEAKKEDAKEEKKIPSKEKKEAKAEKDALPSEVEAQLKKKVSQQSHTLLFAQRAVEFVRQHQLHTLAERALMMMAATDGEILMRSRSINFDRQKGLRAKMKHFFYLVKLKDKSGEVEAMVSYAWDLIKKQVCPEETSRSRSKERQERHSRTHHSPKRRSRSRRTREKEKRPSRGRRSRRRRSRSGSSPSRTQRERAGRRAKRLKRSKSKSKVSSSSSAKKAKAKAKAGSDSSSSSSDEADRKAAAAATVAAAEKKLQEPPPAAPVVAAPKGKVAAKSVAVGARSKAKSTPGDGRNHVKKVAAAFSHDDLEVEVQAMNHEESLKAAKAARLAEEQRRSKIEFQIKSSSDPVARMLKLKESLETPAQPAADEGAPGPPSEAPPEEAPEPPPPPEETPEDIDGLPWQEDEEEEEAQEEAEVVPQGEHEQAAWDWLKNLDGGRGSLLKYFEVMRDEFDCDFAQLAAARLETPVSPGALGHLEPSFFEALGVEQIGHRLLLARGILALEQ